MVFTPCAFMCWNIACAMTSLPCGRRNSHWSWPGGTPTGDAATCSVFASAATGAIAAATGVRHEPRIRSTWSSVTRRRVLLTPLPGSLASSRTIRLTFSPAISFGNSASCFCIGMPRPEPGPVNESTTPTLTSAIAAAEAAITASASRVLRNFMRAPWGKWLASTRRHAQGTVQADDFAVQVRVRDDMTGQLRELFGSAQARRKRDRRGERLLHCFGQLAQQRRGEQPGRDRADADAVLCKVARHRKRHAHQTTFGGAVGLLADLAVEGRDRSGEHHHAALVVFEWCELRAFGGEEATGVVRADQVDIDHARKVFQRRGAAIFLHDPLGAADARDVHEDACRAVHVRRLRQCGRQALGISDVALAGDAVDFRGDFLGLREIDVEHGDLRAQPRQFTRCRFAQALRTAGDERRLSFDLHWCFSFGVRVKGNVPSCSAFTTASRHLSTARWLIEPLSVTSPLSMEGGSCSR